MAQKIAARGRPKGTGLNDADRLAAMAKLIAANPGMKPTTAIKAMGITNPSAIRRLRDKYNQQAAQNSSSAPAAQNARPPAPRHNVIQLRTNTPPPRKDVPDRAAPRSNPTARPEESTTAAEPAPDDHPASAQRIAHQELFSAALAAGVSAAQVAIHLQLKTMSYAFQGSPIACFLRGQELLRLMTASLEGQASKPRSSRP